MYPDNVTMYFGVAVRDYKQLARVVSEVGVTADHCADTLMKLGKTLETLILTEDDLEVSFLPEVVRIARELQTLSVQPLEPLATPILAAVMTRKGYRRKGVDAGTVLKIDSLKIGKRDGLIVCLKPDTMRSAGTLEYDAVELLWREFADGFPDTFDKLRKALKLTQENYADFFDNVNERMSISFTRTPAMYKATVEGLARALDMRSEWVNSKTGDSKSPAFGIF